MALELVLREDRDGLAILTLNRPDRMNSLNDSLFGELLAHLDAIAGDTGNIGCVLLRGAGRCFSAGHDLGDIDPDHLIDGPSLPAAAITRLATLPQPVIAAVHGACYTGGLELALGADIILAADSARFADTHAKWALTPVWGLSQRLPRRIGLARAREMMMTCRPVPGVEAAAIGLANHCYPDSEFEAHTVAFAVGILKNSWFSLRANKTLLGATDGMTIADGLAYEYDNSEGIGPDMKQRLDSFAQRQR